MSNIIRWYVEILKMEPKMRVWVHLGSLATGVGTGFMFMGNTGILVAIATIMCLVGTWVFMERIMKKHNM